MNPILKRALLEHPETDGIFASSDLIAAQVLQRLYAMGKRVPEDIKVVGFDDTVIAGITTRFHHDDPSAD